MVMVMMMITNSSRVRETLGKKRVFRAFDFSLPPTPLLVLTPIIVETAFEILFYFVLFVCFFFLFFSCVISRRFLG